MHKLKKGWYKLPTKIRKPIVLIIGTICIILSALTGWLPGPGGIPLFLLGIAVLATEFVWAEKVRDFALLKFRQFAKWYKANIILGTCLLMVLILAFVYIAYLSYEKLYR